jgi:hypothetical protein
VVDKIYNKKGKIMNYNIDEESVKKIVAVNNLLNELEVKGASNISILYNVMLTLQQVVKSIEDNSKNIKIDNSKKEE